jgi:hypothetical protein
MEEWSKSKLTIGYKKEVLRHINLVKKKRGYLEIFRLIVDHEIDYTLNNNGVFFNLTSVDDALIRKIYSIAKKYQKL